MDVHLRLGPGLSQQIGAPRLTVSIALGSTVQDLFEYLRASFPAFSANSATVLAVIGGATVGDRHVLESGSEVALLLPVSGGSTQSQEEGSTWP